MELDAKLFKAEVRLNNEVLEDSIERGQLRQTIMQLMAEAIARELGADITVNYRTAPDWAAAVRAATGGRGVDIVVETVGLATLSQSLSCCAPNARVGLLGALGGRPEGGTDLAGLIAGNAVVKGITSGSRRMLEDLLRACVANGVRPKIDRRFTFDEAPAAYRYLESGEFVGKVVLEAEILSRFATDVLVNGHG